MDFSGKIICKADGIKHKEMEGKSVLLNLETGNYYTLNRVGTFIWDLLDNERDVDGIADRVTEAFLVDRDEAMGDLNDLIRDLQEEGLVRLENGPE